MSDIRSLLLPADLNLCETILESSRLGERSGLQPKFVPTLLEQKMLASFLSCCLLHYHYHLSAANQIPALISIPRHLLQLHHDDGGEQRGVDSGGAQLSPQDGRDPRDAHVGE